MRNRTPLGFCAAVALAMGGCADNETSLFVESVLLGDPPECDYRADPGSTRLFAGTLDVGFRTHYEAVLLVGNQQIPRGSKEQLRTETMAVQVRGAEVRLTDSDGASLGEFSVPTSGYVPPTSAEAPGYGASLVTIIPPGVGQELSSDIRPGRRKTVVADIRVFGETGGDVEVTSGSTNFVIEVCHGCLSVAPEDPEITCLHGVTEDAVAGCFPGQDQRTDCRYCATDECASIRP